MDRDLLDHLYAVIRLSPGGKLTALGNELSLIYAAIIVIGAIAKLKKWDFATALRFLDYVRKRENILPDKPL